MPWEPQEERRRRVPWEPKEEGRQRVPWEQELRAPWEQELWEQEGHWAALEPQRLRRVLP